ncbi:MAG: IS4 family transposase [Cyclobacteriaceae bacterium]|nr:IS4 family transposase [Cyclobacteriaceae bacterium]
MRILIVKVMFSAAYTIASTNTIVPYLSEGYITMFIGGEADPAKVEIFDSSTVSLFVDVFKGAGRNPMNGKKKGGLKIHTKMPLAGFVPDFLDLSEAASNDKTFLGQLTPSTGTIYVFDKGYVKYKIWAQWTEQGAFYVTRLNSNAQYEVLSGQPNHISQYVNGGIISDQVIELKWEEIPLKARLIVYKDPVSSKVLKFVSNMMEYKSSTIIQLYKYRWGIEVLFKQIKQNFELNYFYSDSPEGIKTQIWIVLIANLIFTVIHRQVKECEQFITIVSMASNNLGSYCSLVKLLKRGIPTGEKRNIKIIQLEVFNQKGRGDFEVIELSP